MVSLLRNTQRHSDTPGDLYDWVCVCVRGEWDHNSLFIISMTFDKFDMLRKQPHFALLRLGTHCSNLNRRTPKQALSSWAAS